MRQSAFTPRPLTWLASALAALASGQALAETAGKVSFVTGNVTATTADGQSRALKRGDAINGGDRIETRNGRLQIRFTDGGFVALQPNTVFGVDNYLYANKAPEETSLFFSLLRGGMRTVTGAIGKVNKQGYKVRTPVATIGIRGTGYRAVTDDDRTLVSVGSGLVHVENGFGEITGGAGQNILARNSQPPLLTREGADIPATGPEGERDSGEPEDDDTPALGDQVQGDGTPLLAQTNAAGDLIPNPAYLAPTAPAAAPLQDGSGYTLLLSDMTPALQNILADFDGSGTLVDAQDNTSTMPVPALVNLSASALDVGTASSLSWGRYAAGDVQVGDAPSTLSGNDSVHYLIGMATFASAMANLTGSATYSLVGHTTPTTTVGSVVTLGSSVSGTLTADFSLSSLQVAMAVVSGSSNYSISGPITFSGATFEAFGLGTTLNGANCFSYCGTDVTGFFAGTQAESIGLMYKITDNFSSYTHGAAAFSKNPITALGP